MTEDSRIGQIREAMSEFDQWEHDSAHRVVDRIRAILDSALPDSDTEWATEEPDGELRIAKDESEARWIVSTAEPTWKLKSRPVGPWIEVTS